MVVSSAETSLSLTLTVAPAPPVVASRLSFSSVLAASPSLSDTDTKRFLGALHHHLLHTNPVHPSLIMDDITAESVAPTNPSSEDPLASSAATAAAEPVGIQNPSQPLISTKRPSTRTSDDVGAENKGKKKRYWLWDHFELKIKDGGNTSN